MSAAVTPIACLQGQWDAANATYAFHEEAECKCGTDQEGEVARYAHQRAASAAFRQAVHLSHAILYQTPADFRDALILLGHAFNMVDLGEGAIAEDREALDAAMDALFAFLGDNGGAELGGWLGDSLRHAKSRVLARSTTQQEGR